MFFLLKKLPCRGNLGRSSKGEAFKTLLSGSHSPSPLPSSAQPWHTDDTETQLNRNTNWRGWVQQGRSGNQLSALINFCIKHTLSVVCYQLLAETKQLGQGKTATALIWIMVIGWLIRAPVVNHNPFQTVSSPGALICKQNSCHCSALPGDEHLAKFLNGSCSCFVCGGKQGSL